MAGSIEERSSRDAVGSSSTDQLSWQRVLAIVFPDGTQVAFAWNGEKQDNWDIYVKQIGVEPPYQLTNDPAMDYSPAWSPDGRFLAFLREVSTGKTAIMLTPQRGGSERILAEIDGAVRRLAYGPFLSWTPDSKWLVAPTSTPGQRSLALHFSRRKRENSDR